MINFKYALLQLVRKITTTFFIVLQIALAFFLMFTLIEVKNGTAKTLKAIDSIYKDSSDMFTIADLERTPSNTDRKERMLSYINEKGYNYIICESGFLYLDKNNSINNLSEIFLESRFNNNYYDADKIELDYKAYKYFNLEAVEGAGLEEKDFEHKEKEYVPVLIGKGLTKYFKVGDTFQGLSGDKKKNEKFKIVGIIKENSSVLSGTGVYEILNVDNYFIIPKTQENVFETLGGKIFFGRKTSDLKNFKERVEQDFNDMNISTQVNLVDENLKDIERGIKTQRNLNNITFIVVLLFSSVGFISSLLYSINKRLSEFGVHLMSGGTIGDIAMRIFIEISIQIVISFIGAYIFRTVYVPYKIKITDLYESIIYAIVICVSISVVPVTKILRINIDQLLRGRE